MKLNRTGSIWNRNERININDNWDMIEKLLLSLNNLVIDNVIDEEQLTKIIETMNGLVKKGEVSVRDINTNLGKLGLEHLSDEVIESISGDAPINAVPADNSITTEKLADKSVTPSKLSILEKTKKNLFSGEYKPWVLIGTENAPILRDKYQSFFGGLAVIPVEHGKKYTITLYEQEKSNVYRLASSSELPTFEDNQYFLDGKGLGKGFTENALNNPHIWTNDQNMNYLYIYTSNNGSNPKLQVEEGVKSTGYEIPFKIKEELLPITPNIVVEDPIHGYPERPNLASVIYQGVNEPTDAEPFDEWRKTGGFSYQIDTNEFNYSTFGSVSTVEARPNGELFISSSTPGVGGVILEDIQDNHMIAQEIFIESRNETNIDRSASALHYYSGEGTSSFYAVIAYSNRVLISKKTKDGIITNIASVEKAFNQLEKIRIRSRIDGEGIIYAKVWQSTEDEPTDWDIIFKDTDPLEPTNKLGIYNFYRGNFVTNIGVSTGGATAPTRKWW